MDNPDEHILQEYIKGIEYYYHLLPDSKSQYHVIMQMYGHTTIELSIAEYSARGSDMLSVIDLLYRYVYSAYTIHRDA